jgi:hypothetical protein
MKTLIGTILASTLLAGCATSPSHISAAYVSPLKYASYDCDQLTAELDAVDHRRDALFASIKKRAKGDSVKMGIGLFVAWPALLFLKGNDDTQNVEYAQLKGDHDALVEAGVRQKCNVTPTVQGQ